jgi:2-polyprenyl-3-methyl-5-hydroxy-6-metoxy-1,4-benzoquinol methylase
MKLKDQNGNTITGMTKNILGDIVVTDTNKYYKYIREKESIQKMNNLENEVQQLKALIETLLRDKNG